QVVGRASRLSAGRLALETTNAGETPGGAGGTPAPLPQQFQFDGGDPAILEVPVGKGRVIVLASGWRTEDSQLALSTKFVPLLYSLLDQSGAATPSPGQYYVGDVVPLASL